MTLGVHNRHQRQVIRILASMTMYCPHHLLLISLIAKVTIVCPSHKALTKKTAAQESKQCAAKNSTQQMGRYCAGEVAEHLLSKHKTLSSNPSTAKKKKSIPRNKHDQPAVTVTALLHSCSSATLIYKLFPIYMYQSINYFLLIHGKVQKLRVSSYKL
jgi:hypothetical protein